MESAKKESISQQLHDKNESDEIHYMSKGKSPEWERWKVVA
jgi:hypothetical protein